MNRKVLLTLSILFIIVVSAFNFNFLSTVPKQNVSLANIVLMAQAEEESGNQSTCYSTYQEPGFLQSGHWIWVCGSCVQVKAKNYSDSGICYH